MVSTVLCAALSVVPYGTGHIPAEPDTLSGARVSADRSRNLSAGSPLQSVSAAEIERRGAVQLSEVVRSFSGVSVKDYGGIGGLKTVSVRSLGAQHTAVVYDGFVVSDAQSGQTDISRFNLDNISSVGMSIGGEDDIFCSARLLNTAGTLRMESARPVFDSTSFHLSAGMRAGSFGTYNPHVLYQQKFSERWCASLSANCLTSDGAYPFTLHNGSEVTRETRLGSDVESLTGEADIYGTIGAGTLRAKLSWYDSERGLPGSVILYTQHPTERLWDRQTTDNISYDISRGRLRARVQAGFSFSNSRYVDENPSYAVPEDDRYEQKEYSAAAVLQYSPSERLRFTLAEDFFVNDLDSNIPECQFPVRNSSITALSAQYRTDRLTLTGSLSETFIKERVETGSAAPDRSRLSPSVSASYLLSDGLRIRGFVRDGFRVPTFNDLYYARVGNTNLQPEKALQTGLGLTWWHSGVTLTADAYFNRVEDKIVAVPTMFIWKMRNVGRALMAGADLSASYTCHPADWLQMHLSGNFSYQYAVDATDSEAKNWMNQIPYTPRVCGGAVALFETRWVTLSYTLDAVGKRYSLPQNIPANEISGYMDHSLSLSRTFTLRRVRIRACAEALNMGNVNYEIVRWYPMPGRNYRFTIKITY